MNIIENRKMAQEVFEAILDSLRFSKFEAELNLKHGYGEKRYWEGARDQAAANVRTLEFWAGHYLLRVPPEEKPGPLQLVVDNTKPK